MALLDLFWNFLVISLLAFGGGGPALALVEQISVAKRGWITPHQFAAAVSFSFVTPGPILTMATFIGYIAAGLPGAAIATVGVFVMPWALAAAAAHRLRLYMRHRRVRGFGRGALPAIVGLWAVTVLSLSSSADTNLGYLSITLTAAALSVWTKLHPIVTLLGAAVTGVIIALPPVASLLPSFNIPTF